MHFVVKLHGRVTVKASDGQAIGDADEILEQHLDSVMDELGVLDAQDPAIAIEMATGEVQISVLVETSDPVEAVRLASGIIRTAIHAAGGSTPNWPDATDKAWGVVLVSLTADPVELVTA